MARCFESVRQAVRYLGENPDCDDTVFLVKYRNADHYVLAESDDAALAEWARQQKAQVGLVPVGMLLSADRQNRAEEAAELDAIVKVDAASVAIEKPAKAGKPAKASGGADTAKQAEELFSGGKEAGK